MVHLSASLLAADYARLGEEVQRAGQAGVDSFHFDMMDGHYVPNLALAPEHLTALRGYTHLPFIVHLELANPEEILPLFKDHAAEMIIVQWNTLTDPCGIFERIRACHAQVGLGLNPEDKLEVASHVLGDIDLLLLLGVHPGFGGQPMQPGTLERISRARGLLNRTSREITLAVDGGVNPSNAFELVDAGADWLIMGTALFQSHGMQETVRSIRESASASPRH